MAIYLGSEQVGGGVDSLSILDLVYPVGSIYMSINSTSPTTLFGGTWEQIEDRFLLAAGSTYTAGGTGGAATVTLTANQTGVHQHTHSFTNPTVNSHNHKITDESYNITTSATAAIGRTSIKPGTGTAQTNVLYSPGGGLVRDSNYTNGTSVGTSGGAVGNTTAASATEAHENMPPYLTVYMWKRTA